LVGFVAWVRLYRVTPGDLHLLGSVDTEDRQS
jgi:hypothetical protein